MYLSDLYIIAAYVEGTIRFELQLSTHLPHLSMLNYFTTFGNIFSFLLEKAYTMQKRIPEKYLEFVGFHLQHLLQTGDPLQWMQLFLKK